MDFDFQPDRFTHDIILNYINNIAPNGDRGNVGYPSLHTATCCTRVHRTLYNIISAGNILIKLWRMYKCHDGAAVCPPNKTTDLHDDRPISNNIGRAGLTYVIISSRKHIFL